jgi:hypothetical protein
VAFAGQEELERRLLALIRDYIDNADSEEIYNDGWEIDEVTLVMKIREPPPDDEALASWDGGSSPGWAEHVTWTTTARSDWIRLAMLEEALRMFHDRGDVPPHAEQQEQEDA